MAMYGKSATVPDRTIVGDITRYFIDAMYYIPTDTSIDTPTDTSI